MAQENMADELARLKAELAASVKERDEAVAAAAAAQKAAEKAAAAAETGIKVIQGKYKGYQFDDGHINVRNRAGELCDTAKLLAAANDKKAEGHDDAVGLLDWLIDIQYAYFTKA